MLKKKYIIIALGIVSVLLGSLLYTNLVLAGKPQKIYKEAVEISVLDWVARQYTTVAEYGIRFMGTMDFPFVFSPKPLYLEDINITGLWISVLLSTEPGFIDTVYFDLTINNDITIHSGATYLHCDHVYSKSFYEAYSQTLQIIKQGANLLKLSNLISGHMVSIHKITVLIEYEYQAR